jgi:hypothetical protein
MESVPFQTAPRFLQFGEPDVMTFLMGWCALSAVGTLIALSLIRAGKRRQPEADQIAQPQVVVATTRYKR